MADKIFKNEQSEQFSKTNSVWVTELKNARIANSMLEYDLKTIANELIKQSGSNVIGIQFHDITFTLLLDKSSS